MRKLICSSEFRLGQNGIEDFKVNCHSFLLENVKKKHKLIPSVVTNMGIFFAETSMVRRSELGHHKG